MIDLKGFEYDELIEYLTSVGEKKFRAEQIFYGFIKAWKAMMK